MEKLNSLMTLIPGKKNDEVKQTIQSDPGLATTKTRDGISLLQFAVYCRNEEIINYLLPFYDHFDIFEAASLGNLQAVRDQLKANPSLLNAFAPDGFTPLGLACFFNQLAIVRFLLETGANPNIASRNAFKVAPIHSSTSIGNIPITELLIHHGADVNARQQQDVTPLHQAGHSGNLEMTRLLLKHGADVGARTSDGKTPLDMALEKGFDEVAKAMK